MMFLPLTLNPPTFKENVWTEDPAQPAGDRAVLLEPSLLHFPIWTLPRVALANITFTQSALRLL